MSRLLDLADAALREYRERQNGPNVIADQAEDLREHFNERAAIMEHDGQLPRETAELEAARMTATLARNRRYSWAALREAFAGYPAILALLPDRQGPVDSLPLGVSKLAVLPGRKVIPQGRHEGAA